MRVYAASLTTAAKEGRAQKALEVNRMDPVPVGSGDEPFIFHHRRWIPTFGLILERVPTDHDPHGLLVTPQALADPLRVFMVFGNGNDRNFVVKGHNTPARTRRQGLALGCFFRVLVILERSRDRSDLANRRRTRRRPAGRWLNKPQLVQQT
jgi:hypothetical protein